MNKVDDLLKKSIDEAVKRNTVILTNPEEVENMKKKGFPIVEKFTPYSVYIKELYEKRIKIGLKLLHQLPFLEKSVASAVIEQIYSEIRDSLAFGELSSTIMNSMLLLEFAIRLRTFNKIRNSDPKFEWAKMEEMDFDNLLGKLQRYKIVTETELKKLNDFKEDFRNLYFHMNVYKMAKGKSLPQVDRFDLKTGKLEIIKDIKLESNPFLWFAAKVKFDHDNVFIILNFCIEWTNKLLSKTAKETK